MTALDDSVVAGQTGHLADHDALAADYNKTLAAGDLMVGTGAQVRSRLAVGSIDQVLTADPAQAGKMRWAAIPSFVANVKDAAFGALGDAATDDTSAIQDAIDSLPTNLSGVFGGTAYLPPGIYIISGDLTVPNGVRLKGAGPTATIIRAASGATFTKAMIRNADASGGQEFCWVSDMQVQGVKAGGATVPVGILFDTVFANSGIDNVVVVDCTGIGIQVKCVNNNPGGTQNSGPVRIHDVWSTRNNGHNIEVLGQVNTCWITDVTVENTPTAKAGIHIKGPLNAGITGGFTSGLGTSIRNVHFENSTAGAYAIWLEDAPLVTIDNVQASAADATTEMVRITGTLTEDYFHSVKISCRNIAAGPGIGIQDVTRGVTISGSVAHYETGKLLATGGLGVGNALAATTPGSVVKKMEVFNSAGASLGFVPIYNAIT